MNVLTDAGLELVAKALRDGTSIEMKYIAVGASNLAESSGSTQLGDERFRKVITQQMSGGTGNTQTICYIAPFECNDFVIEEIGAYAGDAASSQANSGVLISRWLYHRQKTNLESIQVTRNDIFGAG